MVRARLLLTLAPFLLAACGPSISYQRDAALPIPQRATWTWGAPDADGLRGTEGGLAPADSIVRMIQEAIEEQLVAKGFVRAEAAAAQFVVHFHVARRLVIDTLPRRDDPALQDPSRPSGGWGGYGDPEVMDDRLIAWEEGALIVDVLPRSSTKVAWRGSIMDEVTPDAERNVRPAIREAVRRLMRGFP